MMLMLNNAVQTAWADPYWSNVSLLLHMNGTDGSTTFTDVTGKTVSVFGNTQIDTAQSKFGGASGLFDGNGDYLTVPASTGLNLSSGDFTVEAWIYVTALTASTQTIIDKDGQFAVSYSQYSLCVTAAGKLYALLGNGSGGAIGTQFTGPTTITLNAWHHIALVMSGATCKGFLDGNEEWSGPLTGSARTEGGRALKIGHQTGHAVSVYYNGHIDDLRITKGTARYTANPDN
jgi:hypothetical protein